ncbi:MAG: hypothetical protein GC192_06030 [Bacteroidetes bacterium]|nr:hypothetical protein [Bacteroidota bacterium]
MEDKLPNDRLEEFLRKSLQDHSEAPPGDMWSKIAGSLEPPVAIPPKLTPIMGWWAVAAAAAVVIGLLVGQHLYFSNKINQLSKKLEQSVEGLKELEEGKYTDRQSTEPTNGTADLGVANPAPTNDPVNVFDKKTDKSINNSPNSTLKNIPVANSEKASMDGNNPNNALRNDSQKKSQPEQTGKKSNTSDLVNDDKNSTLNLENSTKLAPESVDKISFENADLQRVWLRNLSPLEQPKANLPTLVGPIIPTKKLSTSRFSIGLSVMPLATTSKVDTVREPKQMPGQMEEQKSFELKEEKSDKAWMAGLAIETKLTPRLSIGSGVNYRSVDYQTSHKFEFDFKDRRPNGGPHHDHEHEFQYNLNTAAGTVEMDVRAESTLSAMDIPDNEKIDGEISIKQHFTYISTPIYASYSLGNARLKALVKGGVLFNFLKENDFSVGPIRSLNDKFDFSRRDEQSGSPTNLQTITLDYLVGVGLEYSLTKALSLRLEPTVIGSVTSRHNNPNIQSSEFSAGINAGVMYNF